MDLNPVEIHLKTEEGKKNSVCNKDWRMPNNRPWQLLIMFCGRSLIAGFQRIRYGGSGIKNEAGIPPRGSEGSLLDLRRCAFSSSPI